MRHFVSTVFHNHQSGPFDLVPQGFRVLQRENLVLSRVHDDRRTRNEFERLPRPPLARRVGMVVLSPKRPVFFLPAVCDFGLAA